MNKFLRGLIYLCAFAILLFAFIYLGKKDYKNDITDAIKFSREYTNISENNPYVYVKSYEVLDIMENKSGIILIGFSNNPWMVEYVNQLTPIFNNFNINKIYYYDVQEDRARNTKNYVKIEEKLSPYLKVTDSKKESLFTPALVFIQNGKVVNYDDETSIIDYNENPTNYWNETNKYNFYTKIANYLLSYDYNKE